MKQIIKTEGIVLKTTDYKEQAVLAYILTKDGLKNYIIKGAKKISGGTRLLASVLTKLEFNATELEGLSTLTEGAILDNYLSIKQNMDKLFVAYPIIEKIITFTDQVTNKQIFYNFVCKIFDLLSKDTYEQAILAIFEAKLTFLLGISPELKICVKCAQEAKTGAFSIYNGGIICDKCNTLLPYDLNTEDTEIFKLIYLIKLDKITKEFIELVKDHIKIILPVLDKYYSKHLDFYSKSKQILKEMKL